MTAERPCPHCANLFLPSRPQHALLLESQRKGMRLLMLECQACGQYVDVDPMAPTGAQARAAEPAWRRCPVPGCAGWCVDISDVPAREPLKWGCGECGTTWAADLASLEQPSRDDLNSHNAFI